MAILPTNLGFSAVKFVLALKWTCLGSGDDCIIDDDIGNDVLTGVLSKLGLGIGRSMV